MHHFTMKNGTLFAEGVNVKELAKQYGTPLYIYSTATLTRHFQAFDSAFDAVDHLTCYSVKANSNLSVLRLLAGLGAGMFNVESVQELIRINDVAREMGKTARVSFRINPDVDPKTHPYISTGMSCFQMASGLFCWQKAV